MTRVSTHFLPKFNNQDDGKRLFVSTPGATTCLVVSKKHSGSLLMAPPFHSKNSTGNRFSRLGAITFRDYMCAVWDESVDRPEAFTAWWADAEEKGLCYSFELVVPRALGDHGATPKAAYLVLTTVALTRGPHPRFLSPAEVIEVATRWRLPLNETWYFSSEMAPEVETRLHEARWTLRDSGVDNLLEGGVSQKFLTHLETQGEVLEGFVLMAVETDLEGVAALVTAYNETMAPHHAAALKAALDLGERCSRLDPELEALIDGGVPNGGVQLFRGESFPAPEPERLSEDAWPLALRASGEIGELFKVLDYSYRHQVALVLYSYQPLKGPKVLLVQIRVCDDNVFYAWPLHGVRPLYRGMVVEFGAEIEGAEIEEPSVQMSIRGIAKLKCLNYLWRTFGVRNQLPTLLTDGSEAYLRRCRSFFSNWSVPAEHRPALFSVFVGWARFVQCLPAHDRALLTGKNKEYLKLLERYLGSGVPALAPAANLLTGIDGSAAEPESPWASWFCVVLNLTGKPVDMTKFGISEDRRVPNMKEVSGGYFFEVKTPVTIKKNTIVVVFGTAENPLWKQVDPWRTRNPTVPFFVNPEAAFEVPPPAVKPTVVVVGILALPPGGGKTTMMQALAQVMGGTVVSSDVCRANGKNFDVEVQAAVKKGLVFYDKNIPDELGLAKMLRVLGQIDTHDVKVAFLVPQELDRAACWGRIEERDASYTLNVKGMPPGECEKVFNDFFEKASGWLPEAQKLGLVTRAFFGEASAGVAGELVEHALSLDAVASFMEEKPAGWCSAELLGTGLHVTLVPPPNKDTDEGARVTRLKAMKPGNVNVTLGDYFKATKEGAQVCFWRAKVDLKEHLPSQMPFYHVTDIGSLKSAKPADSLEVLKLLATGDTGAWTVAVTPLPPITLEAVITLH